MNQDEYKIRNLESQILYLQQEHSNTLKLLHNEIKDLQMKNSETSLQLAMLNITGKDCEIEGNHSDNVYLLDQIVQMKAEIEALNNQLINKIAQLENYNEKINQLTETITKIKESHKTEIASMEMELASKSSDIVNLSAKLLKRLDNFNATALGPGDTGQLCPSDQYTAQPAITPKTFKFRNQISVHPDNIHLRRRPIIARQTVVSTSLPIKSLVSQPSVPEYAISVEDRATFPKSIRRPNILPPIQSSRNNFHNEGRVISSTIVPDSNSDHHQTQYFDLPKTQNPVSSDNADINSNFSHLSIDPKSIQVEVERLLDINNSSLHSTSSQTVNWNLTKKSPS